MDHEMMGYNDERRGSQFRKLCNICPLPNPTLIILALVQNPAYAAGYAEKGTGCYMRKKAVIENHVGQHRSVMFNTAIQPVTSVSFSEMELFEGNEGFFFYKVHCKLANIQVHLTLPDDY